MTTYYRGPDVVVTSQAFVTMGAYGACRLPIDEVSQVYIVRGDLHPARTISAHVVGAAVLCVAASWPFLDSPQAFLVALLVLTAPSAVSVGCVRLAPRAYELRAVYRSHDVRLYTTVDSVVFGQVRRALVRALEERATRWDEDWGTSFTSSYE